MVRPRLGRECGRSFGIRPAFSHTDRSCGASGGRTTFDAKTSLKERLPTSSWLQGSSRNCKKVSEGLLMWRRTARPAERSCQAGAWHKVAAPGLGARQGWSLPCPFVRGRTRSARGHCEDAEVHSSTVPSRPARAPGRRGQEARTARSWRSRLRPRGAAAPRAACPGCPRVAAPIGSGGLGLFLILELFIVHLAIVFFRTARAPGCEISAVS